MIFMYWVMLVVGGGNEYDDGGDNDENINDFVNDSDCW